MALFRCNSSCCVYEDYYPPDDTCIKCNKGTIRIITPQGDNTMTAITPTIKLHTFQGDNNTGIHINNLILEHDGNNYQLHGGTRDTKHAFTGRFRNHNHNYRAIICILEGTSPGSSAQHERRSEQLALTLLH
jgi:hypothetical protein